jgi:hypothetical protein
LGTTIACGSVEEWQKAGRLLIDRGARKSMPKSGGRK